MANTLHSKLTPGLSVTRYTGPIVSNKSRARYQVNQSEKFIDLSADEAIGLILLLTKQLHLYRECDMCEVQS